jgi:hypothetical protein
MRDTITIQFSGTRRAHTICLDLDHIPTVCLGDSPPCAPHCGDVRLHFSAEDRLYFWAYYEFIRIDNTQVRRPDGSTWRIPPQQDERWRRYKALSDAEVREAERLYGEGLSSAVPGGGEPLLTPLEKLAREYEVDHPLARNVPAFLRMIDRLATGVDRLVEILFDDIRQECHGEYDADDETIRQRTYGPAKRLIKGLDYRLNINMKKTHVTIRWIPPSVAMNRPTS